MDVGAHHGETTLAILERFPDARVHALEPVKMNFNVLRESVGHFPNVQCHQLALGDRSEFTRIVLREDSQTHTLKCRAATAGDHSSVQTTPVEVTTLDSFVRDVPLERLDLIKIDVEGYELNVLSGGRDTLSKRPPRFILVEATLDPADNVHCHLLDITSVLAAYNYHLLSIYDQAVWARPLRLAYFNALFGLDTCLSSGCTS
jgi:FkbM family methyltransferase